MSNSSYRRMKTTTTKKMTNNCIAGAAPPLVYGNNRLVTVNDRCKPKAKESNTFQVLIHRYRNTVLISGHCVPSCFDTADTEKYRGFGK